MESIFIKNKIAKNVYGLYEYDLQKNHIGTYMLTELQYAKIC